MIVWFLAKPLVFFYPLEIHNHSNTYFVGANNLIPMEIALKIANKIRAHERFAAYIVVPMWPEGVPTGAATQRILFWQVCQYCMSSQDFFVHNSFYHHSAKSHTKKEKREKFLLLKKTKEKEPI